MRIFLLLLCAIAGWTSDTPGLDLGLGPAPVTSAAPSGAASGDLSGTYPSPTVAAINGVPVSGAGAHFPTVASSDNGAGWIANAATGHSASLSLQVNSVSQFQLFGSSTLFTMQDPVNNVPMATYTPGTSATGYWTVGNTTPSTSTGTGAFVVSGGIGAGGACHLASLVIPGSTTADTLTVGTIGLQGYALNNCWFGDNVSYNGAFKYTATGTANLIYFNAGTLSLQSASGGAAGSTATFATGLSISNTGVTTLPNTTDATTASAAGSEVSGGLAVVKNVIAGLGLHPGVASTATAGTTTTLAATSTQVQIFTGSTTQTVNLPAAALFGAGISVHYVIINRSTGTVTLARAGSDTINAAATTYAILTTLDIDIYSDGVSAWYTK